MSLFSTEKWIAKYNGQLCGKRVVLFGASGGLGSVLCQYILQLGGELVTVDRNPKKSADLRRTLEEKFPGSKIDSLIADLEDMNSVKQLVADLKHIGVDIIIHNAGAYNIPRQLCDTGYDNVFQINFISPYYITESLISHLAERNGRVVVVGSIAHNYAKSDALDVDFRTRSQASLAYGNAKRYWMYSAFGLAKIHTDVKFAVVHPGIAFTNITAHYPKWLFWIIKNPMKLIFMPPKRAALSIVEGMFEDVPIGSWIGPRIFQVWGKPSVRELHTATKIEQNHICKTAKRIYMQIQRS